MPDVSGQARSASRTRSTGSPTRRHARQGDAAGDGGGGLVRSAWAAVALCVVIFTGADSYAEAGGRAVPSDELVPTPSELSLAPACVIRVERWVDSCIEESQWSNQEALEDVADDVVDLDQFSLSRRHRDKDHLVYRSSEGFGPQFSFVVVEPRTRAFNLGLHLRFEYAF